MLRAVGNPLTSLSDRERVVAAKFAEGMTYREIGETLFIAPTTVRTHLSAIYRKLGVRSKVALATLLADHREQDADQALPEGLPTDDSGPPVVAVIPFDNLSGDEYWTRLADGLSADIIVDLARYPDLAVIARQTMLAYKGRRDDVRSIGRELNADYVLEGTLQADGQRVRICVQLVDAALGLICGRPATIDRRKICLRCRTASPKTSSMSSQLATASSQNCDAMRPVGSPQQVCAPMITICLALSRTTLHPCFEHGGNTATDACCRTRPWVLQEPGQRWGLRMRRCHQRLYQRRFRLDRELEHMSRSKRWRSTRPTPCAHMSS